MPKFQDLTGKQFGDLSVIGLGERYSNGKIAWECKCKCGRIVRRITFDLTHNRHTCCLSCSSKNKNTTHGQSRSKLFYIWMGIKGRCCNPRNKSFHNYGGRGIEICDEWKNSFELFQDWAINNGYEEGLSIERMDVDGNYEPSNCCWITMQEQSKNRRDSIIIEHNGEKRPLIEWADIMGVDRMLATQRYIDDRERGRLFDFDRVFHKGRLDAKPVNQFTLEGVLVKKWNSISEAKSNGFDGTGISMCCNGKQKSSYGYIWRFEGE